MNLLLFRKLNSLANQYILLDWLMIFAAEWLAYILIGVLIILFLKNKKRFEKMFFIAIIAATISRFAFVELIRLFHFSNPPYLDLDNVIQLITREMASSFPSGHASFYFALATGIYLHNRKIGSFYLIAVSLMGFARIFSGVHWPLDILAGAFLGIATAIIVNLTYEKIH